MTSDTLVSPADLAAGNWIWLLGASRQGRALVIAPAGDLLARSLEPHFEAVIHESPSGAPAESNGPEFDFLAISRLEECADGDAEWLSRRLAAAAGWLRPQATVLLTFSNPFWGRRFVSFWRPGRYAQLTRVRRSLRKAGFNRIDSYFLQPFPEPASSIIPDWSHAAHHHERVQHMRSRAGQLRPLLARLGAHALLYPGCACVAYT